MDTATFIKALDLERPDRLDYLGDTFNKLHDLPHSFVSLNWHSSHEYLYISQHVEDLTGYPYKNFYNHGIMFIFSVTPPELIEQISSTLSEQLAPLDNDPSLITSHHRLKVNGALKHSNGNILPMSGVSIILDFLPGQRRLYLVFSTYFSENAAGAELGGLMEEAIMLQRRLHKLYIQMNPSRFRVFESFKLLTPRELEIANLIRNGHNSKSIAEQLSIALHTVTSHRKSMLKKMEAGNTAEMVHLLNQVV